MKKHTTCLLVLALSCAGHSQTTISGGITSNTTWTPSGNPYVVTGNTTVFEGVTLNIDPGVIIKFDSGTGLELRGTLNAIGTATDSIVFTSNASSPSQGSWTGITVKGTSEPLGVGDQITMEYCKGEYANYFVNLDIAYHGPYIFNHCLFKNNNQVNYDGGLPSTLFDNCRFENNQLALAACQFESRVSNSSFIRNVNGVDRISKVDSCFFSENTGIALAPGGSTVGCTIDNNNIGVSSYFNAVNHEFIDNVLKNNDIGIEIHTYFNGSVTFTGNTICDNTTNNVELLHFNNADLSGNCWCSTDSTDIRSTIYDGYMNTAYGLVNFMPFATGCPQSTLGIENDAENTPFVSTIYPNPFTDEINITNEQNEHLEVVINDIAGRIMIQTGFTTSLVLTSESLPKGVYFYKLQNENGAIKTGKLIKN